MIFFLLTLCLCLGCCLNTSVKAFLLLLCNVYLMSKNSACLNYHTGHTLLARCYVIADKVRSTLVDRRAAHGAVRGPAKYCILAAERGAERGGPKAY